MKTRGVTLFEVIIVVTIVGLLAALLVFALAPRMKRKSLETRIRTDLRQLSAAIAIYRVDYDDGLPLSLASLPEQLPKEFPNWPYSSELCPGCYISVARYRLNYTSRMRRIERNYPLGVSFDEGEDAIVDAPFYQVVTGSKHMRGGLTTGNKWYMKEVALRLVLGARTDGSVFWKPDIDEWQNRVGTFMSSPLPRE